MVGAEGGGRTGFRAEAATFTVPASEVVGQDGDAADIVGVLLLNLGGPETLEDVQPFLFNLFADPVCQLHLCSYLLIPLYHFEPQLHLHHLSYHSHTPIHTRIHVMFN